MAFIGAATVISTNLLVDSGFFYFSKSSLKAGLTVYTEALTYVIKIDVPFFLLGMQHFFYSQGFFTFVAEK